MEEKQRQRKAEAQRNVSELHASMSEEDNTSQLELSELSKQSDGSDPQFAQKFLTSHQERMAKIKEGLRLKKVGSILSRLLQNCMDLCSALLMHLKRS